MSGYLSVSNVDRAYRNGGVIFQMDELNFSTDLKSNLESPLPLVHFTSGGTILRANDAFAALLGIHSVEQLIGRNVIEFFDLSEIPSLLAAKALYEDAAENVRLQSEGDFVSLDPDRNLNPLDRFPELLIRRDFHLVSEDGSDLICDAFGKNIGEDSSNQNIFAFHTAPREVTVLNVIQALADGRPFEDILRVSDTTLGLQYRLPAALIYCELQFDAEYEEGNNELKSKANHSSTWSQKSTAIELRKTNFPEQLLDPCRKLCEHLIQKTSLHHSGSNQPSLDGFYPLSGEYEQVQPDSVAQLSRSESCVYCVAIHDPASEHPVLRSWPYFFVLIPYKPQYPAEIYPWLMKGRQKTLLQAIFRYRAQKALLEFGAKYDELTRVGNRRHFYDSLYNTRRGAVIFVDMNGLKRTNDTHGHAVGDLAIVEVARRLRSMLRSTDLVARIGGDEFAIIFQDIRDEYELNALCDRVRRACAFTLDLENLNHETLRIDQPNATTNLIEISASVGGAIFNNESQRDAAVSLADEKMYKEKSITKHR